MLRIRVNIPQILKNLVICNSRSEIFIHIYCEIIIDDFFVLSGGVWDSGKAKSTKLSIKEKCRVQTVI